MSLPSSMADFVPCDRLLQKAYKDSGKRFAREFARSARGKVTRKVTRKGSDTKRKPANTMSKAVTWDDGRRVVEDGMLAEGLESCCFCLQPIQLKNVVDEKRYGLPSLLYIQCSCGQINTVRTGKSHRCTDARRGVPIYDVNTKLARGT